ncbi:MAG: hypothetical protein KGL39_13710 [Patescibacteria group bacterium]|nr:hypothetical protein [Patescibacteria group bacterium]
MSRKLKLSGSWVDAVGKKAAQTALGTQLTGPVTAKIKLVNLSEPRPIPIPKMWWCECPDASSGPCSLVMQNSCQCQPPCVNIKHVVVSCKTCKTALFTRQVKQMLDAMAKEKRGEK